jgi:hypothetical protein
MTWRTRQDPNLVTSGLEDPWSLGPTRPGGTYVNRNFLFLLAGDAVAIPVKVGRGPGLSPAQRSRTRCSYRVEIHPVERAHDGIG